MFDDHVGSDMTKEEFRQLCETAWEKQHGFVIIDLSSKKTQRKKYRSGLDDFYIANLTGNKLFSHENLLKKIVYNTEPKRLFSIVVGDYKTTWFKRPIQLDK